MKNKTLLVILGLGFLLRVTYLDKFPIGLYSDEAVFGYNADLLLQTGHDEYNRFWPVSLESFGDWKPPMSAWLAIPFVSILGLNEYAVRLPSAILGTLTILIVYLLAEILLRPGLASARPGLFRLTPLLAALLLAINPWHIFMSRIAMLVSVEVFFISLGVLGLIRGLHDTVIPAKAGIYRNILYRFRVPPSLTVRLNELFVHGSRGAFRRAGKHGMTNLWWMVSAASFAGAIYSYYGSRVTVPLILSIFCLVYFNEVKKRWREIIFPVIFGVTLLSPLAIQSIKDPLILTGRARTTSVFFNDNVRLQLWDAHTKAGLKKIPPLISRFFDNKLYYYARDIAGRYASHFSPVFLFFRGDSHPPFKIPGLGYLHLIDLPFFVIGLIFLRMNRNEIAASRRGGTRPPAIAWRRSNWRAGNDGQFFLILYLLAAPAVAALTFLTPAANRSFNMVIPWTLITSYGLIAVLTMKQFNNLAMKMTIVLFYLISLVAYSYSYVRITPQELPHYWHYGRKELMNKLKPLLGQYKNIYLTNKGGPPYIFLAFYLNIPPKEFHKTVIRNPIIDELGWGHVDKILNVTIPREFSWSEVTKDKNALYVGFENEIPPDEINITSRVYYPSGKAAYTIGTLKQ